MILPMIVSDVYNLKEWCFAKLCEYILETRRAASTQCCSVCNCSLVNHYTVLKACYNLAAVECQQCLYLCIPYVQFLHKCISNHMYLAVD